LFYADIEGKKNKKKQNSFYPNAILDPQCAAPPSSYVPEKHCSSPSLRPNNNSDSAGYSDGKDLGQAD
jgi:hypothetical protein